MQLNKKAFEANGKETVVTLVKMGDTEGMFVTDVATLLNVTARNIQQLMVSHSLSMRSLNSHEVQKARSEGLIPRNVVRLNIVPRDTIKALVKIVNTPEAWAAYNYLWDVAEDPGVAAEHFKAIGRIDELEAKVSTLTKQVNDATLNGDQIKAILGEMKVGLVRNHIDLSATLRTSTGDRISIFSAVMADLKTLLFGPHNDIRQLLNWKMAKQGDFERILAFVKKWSPSPQTKRWITTSGAWAPGYSPNDKMREINKTGRTRKTPSKK